MNAPQIIDCAVDGHLNSSQFFPITNSSALNNIVLFTMGREQLKNLLQIFFPFRSHDDHPSSELQKLVLGLLAIAS